MNRDLLIEIKDNLSSIKILLLAFLIQFFVCFVMLIFVIESEKEKAVPCETTLPAN